MIALCTPVPYKFAPIDTAITLLRDPTKNKLEYLQTLSILLQEHYVLLSTLLASYTGLLKLNSSKKDRQHNQITDTMYLQLCENEAVVKAYLNLIDKITIITHVHVKSLSETGTAFTRHI